MEDIPDIVEVWVGPLFRPSDHSAVVIIVVVEHPKSHLVCRQVFHEELVGLPSG